MSSPKALPWNDEATVRYPLRFEDHDGTKWDRLDGENIVVALYPWLTQSLALWSRRLADEKAPREQIVDARRNIGNLMQHIHRNVFGPQTHYFILGEMLYVLPQLATLE